MYGQPVVYMCSKMTKKKISRVQFSEELKLKDQDQVIYTDVMTIDKRKSLLSVCDPLQLSLHNGIKDETEAILGIPPQRPGQRIYESAYAASWCTD